ncbi:MAG TPA: hypothetical protein VD962_04830, partial [Rubricoccaceae bacterium]|nr:hypothetical protein [Rubricoccaceae bacterium]
DEAFTLDELGTFESKNSLQREQVYNHGYAFTHYLANAYGEDVLRRVSDELGRWRSFNVERALDAATGEDADAVYERWQSSLRAEYAARTEAVRADPVEGEVIEDDGFFVFHPAFSPDGTKLAYLSNRGQDYSRTSLYVRDMETGETTALDVEGLTPEAVDHACAFGETLVGAAAGRFAWMPDGSALIFARHADTPRGRRFSDLWRYDLESRRTTRLTHERRAADPAVSPDGRRVAFVVSQDGTTNLFVMDLTAEDPEATIRPTTRYADGTQVADPVWHPTDGRVYFSASRERGRDIWRVSAEGGAAEPVQMDPNSDERNPAFTSDGGSLYFASDRNGIFNLYERRFSHAEARPVTNVLGGAFQPAVSPMGQVAFVRYDADGYKLALLGHRFPTGVELAAYSPPPSLLKPAQREGEAHEADFDYAALNAYDDTDLGPLGGDVLGRIRTERSFPLTPGTEPDTRPIGTLRRYGPTFTSFSILPTVRFDRYAAPRRSAIDAEEGRLGRELANTKVGFYASSREVIEGLNLTAGVLVAPASRAADDVADFFDPGRLMALDRDLFLQIESRRGLPMFRTRWSPQLSLEVYNLRRGVEDGLAIEEFPCTACLPDTAFADLAYALTEVGLYARSKVSRPLLLELGFRYSPYSVRTEAFFSREFGGTIPASSDTYFKGRAVMLRAYYEALRPTRTADVIPEGLRLMAGVEYEPSELLDRFEVREGQLFPVFEQFDLRRFTLDARYGMRLPGGAHGLGLRARGTTILGGPVNRFFDDYVGGLTGARGYPFYALGGNETVWLQAGYTFPILPRLERQVGWLYLDKLYGRVYADAAAAWSGPWPGADAIRKDVGAELRLGFDSFYLFP